MRSASFSKDFRGSAKRKTLSFFAGDKNPCFFPKKHGLEGQGTVHVLENLENLEILETPPPTVENKGESYHLKSF